MASEEKFEEQRRRPFAWIDGDDDLDARGTAASMEREKAFPLAFHGKRPRHGVRVS